MKDVLARAQLPPKVSQPALAKLSKIIVPTDAIVSEEPPELKLKWDASFVDEELERRYFLVCKLITLYTMRRCRDNM